MIRTFCMLKKMTFSAFHHRHSNSGPPFFLIWSLPRLWHGSLSGSISLSHLSIFYNISCYNSLVLLTFVSRSSCRFTEKSGTRIPTDNMYNDQKTKNEGQTRFYKILHKKSKIEKLESIKNRRWTQSFDFKVLGPF